jgi:2-polyprenyl-3-methyl-5-hydroxy-6-metoxy-1,4-benzoquinol methylase
MFGNSTDKSWETIGKIDPYYGVLTSDKFRNRNFDKDAHSDFFNGGKDHMINLLAKIEKRFGKIPRGNALDFGCGVGRLTLPLAVEGRFLHVVGMDISESMLKEARKNADKAGVSNLNFVVADDSLNGLNGNFDFIHSFIVFQHIPIKRGEKIVRQLINKLSPGGVAALQMPFARKVGLARKALSLIRVHVRPLHILGNILQKKPWGEPPMQMNRYNLNRIFLILYECGVTNITLEFMKEGSNVGIYIFVQKIA